MRLSKLLLVFALVGVIGVGVIRADDGVPLISDGRVNNWQIDAPVAVYCVFTGASDDSSRFERVEVWGLSGNKLLEASAAEIDAVASAETLDAANGYALEQLSDGSLRVSAPGYTFEWKRGDANC